MLNIRRIKAALGYRLSNREYLFLYSSISVFCLRFLLTRPLLHLRIPFRVYK